MSIYCKLCNFDVSGVKKWMKHLNTNKHKTRYKQYENKQERECSKCNQTKSEFDFLKKSQITPTGIPRDENYFALCNECRVNFKTKWKKPQYLTVHS